MSKEDRPIQRVWCHSCNYKMSIEKEFKDEYNSDFYISTYVCPKCEYAIEIITHELRY